MRTPHFIIIKASAGAGKTFELTKRLAQFLVLPEVKNKRLKNIIAITFSNAATNEMKKRTLQWLKGLALQDERTIKHFFEILMPYNGFINEERLSLKREEISSEAGSIFSEILTHYNDLQIKTIDSFMTSVFSATAIDFGYYGEFDILMENKRFIEHALDIFLNENIVDGRIDDEIFEFIKEITSDKRSDSTFKWDITKNIKNFFIEIYEKSNSITKELSEETYPIDTIIEDIKTKYEKVDSLINLYRLERKERGGFSRLSGIIKNGSWDDLIKLPIKEGPVKKTKNSALYDEIDRMWNDLVEDIKGYALYYSINYYSKVVSFFNRFKIFLDEYKRRESTIFISDISKMLSTRINKENPPEIYFLLGEMIYHYFIDEFQDTSPIQWSCMRPLIENSLSNGGTLFIVGDTKQAIYGFRNTDWRIMKRLSEKEELFLPAETSSWELKKNNRSLSSILDFNKRVFKEMLPKDSKLGFIGEMIGLTTFEQECTSSDSDGFVRTILIEKENHDDEDLDLKVKDTIKGLIDDLIKRGYRLKDIAILTQKNDYVENIANYLLSEGIPSLSFSSLDIRKMPVIMDLISLLKFLNSPLDDLALATFLQSDIFHRSSNLSIEEIRDLVFKKAEDRPLYIEFRNRFEKYWESFFDRPYTRVGYLPLYDLICEIYNTFEIFKNFKNEEACLLKFLEVVKDFEGFQFNNLASFLKEIEEDEDEKRWSLSLPEDIDGINIMTIHKSKGLEFPAVIALLYEKSDKKTNLWITEDKGKGRMVRVTESLKEKGGLLENWYLEKDIFEWSNDLNSLYVCLTRAKRELYVIGVKKSKDKKFPLNLIPFEEYEGKEYFERNPIEIEKYRYAEIGPLYLKPKREPYYLDIKEISKNEEAIRGDLIHLILKKILFVEDGIEDLIEKEIKRINTLYYYDCEIKTSDILKFLFRDDVFAFFEKKDRRQILTEKELVDKEGRLLRIDRLVIDPDDLSVIDFKTGTESSDEYMYQMKRYLKVVKNIWSDKRVRGFIIYFDKKDIWEVNP